MSRKNHIHTMDALIYGYSNFVATAPITTERVTADRIGTAIESATPEMPRLIIPTSEPVLVTPTMETVKPEVVSPTFETVKPDVIATRYSEPIVSTFTPVSIAEDDGRKPITPSPIVNIINPSPYVAPPLIISGGGGGGGAMGERSMPKPASTVVEKPSFLKKNFIPLLLVTSAIYVFIKKPIK